MAMGIHKIGEEETKEVEADKVVVMMVEKQCE